MKGFAADDGSGCGKRIWCFSDAAGAAGRRVGSDYMQPWEREETRGNSLRCAVDVRVYINDKVLPVATIGLFRDQK